MEERMMDAFKDCLLHPQSEIYKAFTSEKNSPFSIISVTITCITATPTVSSQDKNPSGRSLFRYVILVASERE